MAANSCGCSALPGAVGWSASATAGWWVIKGAHAGSGSAMAKCRAFP
eukprot:CAMPEP_0179161266 /NCGR_PEP_ID=MMETSP0796-20121207/78931_1 /TAXON_ID=73915 /ORGANISM="Pyrodinium bahamense, Strain pbaha01" /LENGTH=46 /DNA_ID= /DNA_START= /DNA_END= /DNA_ORIENTATION=